MISKCINFNINYDELDTMPLLKKLRAYRKKQIVYKQRLTSFLMEVKPEDYTMQTTSVFISKSKTIIEVEKKDKEDMKKLISLKRNRDNS